jgi:hypothetical protein
MGKWDASRVAERPDQSVGKANLAKGRWKALSNQVAATSAIVAPVLDAERKTGHRPDPGTAVALDNNIRCVL